MAESIEILLGDVTDVEARLFARYSVTPVGDVDWHGTVRGPYCQGVQTLPAEFEFRPVASGEANVALAEAVVTDPCMWSAEMPHLYNVDIAAREEGIVVAEYHGQIGLRRLAPRRPVDFAPGTG